MIFTSVALSELARVVVAIATFSYTAVEDWRKRDVDPRVWIPGICVGIALSAYEAISLGLGLLMMVSVAISILVVVAFAIAVFALRAMGGADFLAMACLASLMPYPFLFVRGILGQSLVPPLLHILFYSALLSLAPVIANVMHNLKRKELLDELNLPKFKKIKFMLIAKVMTLDEFEKKKFYYPLYVPGIVDRSSFDIEEDDRAWVEKLRSCGARIVVATWGVPTVTVICVAMLIYLLLGVSPIDAVIAALR